MMWFVKRRRAQNPDDYETWQQGGVSPTLNAFDNTGDSRATVIIFTAQRVGEPPRIYENTTPSLLSRMGTGGNNTPMIAFSRTQGLDPQPSEIATPTLRVGGAGMAALTDTVVRRLTPTECERLMGWPDNHTLHRADGKTNSDSTRYKMCGNGVATPVAQWIATQLKELF